MDKKTTMLRVPDEVPQKETRKAVCVESTLDIHIRGGHIRLWINETEIKDEYPENAILAQTIRKYVQNTKNINDTKLLHFLGTLPRINAAQVLDQGGDIQHGVVVYYVDFDTNHG